MFRWMKQNRENEILSIKCPIAFTGSGQTFGSPAPPCDLASSLLPPSRMEGPQPLEFEDIFLKSPQWVIFWPINLEISPRRRIRHKTANKCDDNLRPAQIPRLPPRQGPVMGPLCRIDKIGR